MTTVHKLRSATRRGRRQRRGGLTVEMVLVVVVLAIVTVAIVQFGVFYANAQQVALAARVGALEASQTPNLSTTDGDPVPLEVISAIEHQLESSNIEWCHIRLEHNVDSMSAVELESDQGSPADCDCLPKLKLPSSPTSPSVPFVPTEYVRVTICVPLNQVFPKQISFFGCQLFDPAKTYEHTAVFRYEL